MKVNPCNWWHLWLTDSFLKGLKFFGRKRLAPVEFDFVGVSILVKLIECFCKSGTDLVDLSGVRENQSLFGRVTLLGRVLVDLKKQCVLVTHKSKIELFGITI